MVTPSMQSDKVQGLLDPLENHHIFFGALENNNECNEITVTSALQYVDMILSAEKTTHIGPEACTGGQLVEQYEFDSLFDTTPNIN